MQNVVSRDGAPIVMIVRAFACADHSAFQRRADKKTFRFAVGINCRSRSHIGLSRASHWSRGNACVRSERHISALRKGANSAFVVKHDHKIGHLRADLGSPTCAAGADERRPRPAVSRSRDHYAFAGLSAKNKASFHDADNGETSRTPKNARWNAFLGHMAKLPDCGGRAIDRVLLG